jgi:hypothetical protein
MAFGDFQKKGGFPNLPGSGEKLDPSRGWLGQSFDKELLTLGKCHTE